MSKQIESGLPMIDRAADHHDRTAIIDEHGRYSYGDLLNASANVAHALLNGRSDLADARVCFLVEPSLAYVAAQWGAWRAGGIGVPLCVQHPAPELAHVIDDSACEAIIADACYADRVEPLARERGLRFLRAEDIVRLDAAEPGNNLPALSPARPAMLIYTSGTTSKPKGVVLTHANLEAQIASLVEAWGWRPDDHILELLPLHHLHGVVNVVCCALRTGATCEIMPRFDADAVWDRIVAGDGLTLFMAVPTIYARLVQAWDKADEPTRAARTAGCGKLRLMVCGSAALPVPTLERWRTISGHTLLERYGMTEIGMALSNPLHGERRPGHVGQALPGVSVRLVDDRFNDVADGTAGQILIKSANVFGEYWRNAKATEEAFTRDGWFKTGDVAIHDDGYYRILGRSSIDIIKTGGYKVSALEIEAVLQTHDAIDQCAVVGVPDAEWGERVAAAVVVSEGQQIALDALRAWAKERLAVYKVPSRLLILDELPRNPMGKVTKPNVTRLFESQQQQRDNGSA